MTAKKLDEVINSLDLPEDCFKAMTTDNAANMRVACRESNTISEGLTCFAHTLNLVVNGAIKKVTKIQEGIDKFKRLAGACHKSTLYCERIKRECEDLNKSGTTPVNYTKIIQLRPALEGIRESTSRSTDPHLQELIPESDQFDAIESLVQVLSKFEEVSTFMSSESYPTICWVIQKVFYLMSVCTKIIQEAEDPLR